MNPQYPVYIISKGRWESRLTSKALELMKVPYHIVVEPQEYDNYAAVIDPEKILVLPFSNLGLGGIPARNWVWEHAKATGSKRHWIMDDNISDFRRQNHNIKIEVTSGTVLKVMEDFVDRYENVAIAGPQYDYFAPDKVKSPAFTANTRIYSCCLILNSLPFRWRGRYNEDTDLSLQVLKAGWCTILFYAFLQSKTPTLQMTGGNTDELYAGDGRLRMAQAIVDQHPEIARVTEKWGRYQHQVDYSPFRNNRLVKRSDIIIRRGVNNYGMKLIELEKELKDTLNEENLFI